MLGPMPMAADIDFSARSVDLEVWCAIGGPLGLDGGMETEKVFCSADGSWTPERGVLHTAVLGQLPRADLTSVDGGANAFLLAGPPGAGKTRLRRRLTADRRLPPHVVIDTDEIREVLIARLVADGPMPVVLDDWCPGGLPLTPLELSGACHREAKYLQRRYLACLTASRLPNLVIDTTLSTQTIARGLVADLRRIGYPRISCILVEAHRHEAEARCLNRWKRGVATYFKGTGLGGRYIASANLDSYFPTGSSHSTPLEAYLQLRDEGAPGGFDAASRCRVIRRNGVYDYEWKE